MLGERREKFDNRVCSNFTMVCISTTHSIHIWCYMGIFSLLVLVFVDSDPTSPALAIFIPLMVCLYSSIVMMIWLDRSHLYNSPLTMACALGQPDIVRLLLLLGANPNQTADSEISPVFAAAIFGNWKCIDVLETTYDQHIGGFEIVQPTRRQGRGEDTPRAFVLKEKQKLDDTSSVAAQ